MKYIEVLDASVHPGAAGRDENDFNTNVEAESYKTTEPTRVFKVSNKVHPVIDLQIPGNRVVAPILDEKGDHIIHMFGAKLLNMNPSGCHIDEMERGDGPISLDESRSNKVHLVHLIGLCGIKECVSLFGFDPALYRSRLFTFRPCFFTIRFIVDVDGISSSVKPS